MQMEGLRLQHSPSKQSFEVSFVYGHCGGHDVLDDDDSECSQADSLNVDNRVRNSSRTGVEAGGTMAIIIAVIDLRTRALSQGKVRVK